MTKSFRAGITPFQIYKYNLNQTHIPQNKYIVHIANILLFTTHTCVYIYIKIKI